MGKLCYVCQGTERPTDGLWPFRCQEHDVCDGCGKTRYELKTTPWGTKTGFICEPCEVDRRRKIVSEFAEKNHPLEHFWGNYQIVCPYCGHVYSASYNESCKVKDECPDCNNIIVLEVNATVTYSTSKLEDS